jgi:hypothetical protein
MAASVRPRGDGPAWVPVYGKPSRYAKVQWCDLGEALPVGWFRIAIAAAGPMPEAMADVGWKHRLLPPVQARDWSRITQGHADAAQVSSSRNLPNSP